MKQNKSQAFTLIELAIVLVLIGLLVGGVLAGQSLIHSAELRSVGTEFGKYRAAMNNFRDKYFGYPGDIANATAYWGEAHATPSVCATTQGTGTQTCNGNADGQIATGVIDDDYEALRFWQQLVNAGLIEGKFTGISGPADPTDIDAIPGINVPKAKYANGAWTVYSYNGVQTGGVTANIFVFGTIRVGGPTDDPILSPPDASSIDTKLDDGKPFNGIVMSFREHADLPSCVTYDGFYMLSSDDTSCSMLFHLNY